ncbi:hypothetical protein [Geodermatophilus sabuli]|uniref:Uncharacterized protein n=1 Tax=Geodermatophilus sabuli TaxID=1564158 RepID=A0A285EHF2_9ACTN|nr:hypothetical protein [Geodermatophilus sabuli]MBB3083914.1 2-methylaconitate cis-trans-isomerase PrpF [Geodermatophilus sabuli]SNX98562.1 hypothetical protein SAMN06893097_11176 [Geodermatophilus sabuli]
MRTVVVTDPSRADAGEARTLGAYGVATVHEGPSEHPGADVHHLCLQLGVDETTVSDQPRVVRSGVVRTARTLFDGIACLRAEGGLA